MARYLFAFWSLYLSSSLLISKDITIAVAANFAEPMKAVLVGFKKIAPEIETSLVIGSSGKLFAQIQQGAPFDLFLSADQTKPSKLVNLGLARKNSQYTYAVGSLILWSATFTELSEAFLNSYDGRISVANAKIAPYGMAAKEVLSHYQNDNIQVIKASNVIGAFQYVHSQAVPVGLIAKSSLVHANIDLKTASSWEVDPSLYTPIMQDLVIVKSSKESESVKMLWEYLKSNQAQEVIKNSGYQAGIYD